MNAAGVPTIPGSEGILKDFEETKKLAEEAGYPVMLKALLVVVVKECVPFGRRRS